MDSPQCKRTKPSFSQSTLVCHVRLRSFAISANWARADCRSSTISAAMTSGGGRLQLSSSDSSLSQKMSRWETSEWSQRERCDIDAQSKGETRELGSSSQTDGRSRDRLSGHEGINMSRFSVAVTDAKQRPGFPSPASSSCTGLCYGSRLKLGGTRSIICL
jgi:hypothetical protein